MGNWRKQKVGVLAAVEAALKAEIAAEITTPEDLEQRAAAEVALSSLAEMAIGAAEKPVVPEGQEAPTTATLPNGVFIEMQGKTEGDPFRSRVTELVVKATRVDITV
jgi:post-segregation antitoxin (ccd killing protein)